MDITNPTTSSMLQHFSELKDPRRRQTRVLHPLENLLFITICGVICGADTWVAISLFGKAKEPFFRRFLDLTNGIPSHDTFNDIFRRLNPKVFNKCFSAWVQSLATLQPGEVIAVDGKSLRGSRNPTKDLPALHIVTAWATQNQLALAQIATEDKSNEITAIPKLLKLLNLEDSVVTTDAMGTQKAIARQIIDQKGDYLLALKTNHPNLYIDVECLFKGRGLEAPDITYWEAPPEKPLHGRIETRKVWCSPDISECHGHEEWKGLASVVRIESTRTKNNKTSVENQYFITSLASTKAEQIGRSKRAHWGIENHLHWSLDVSFSEDSSRVTCGHGAENLSLIRKIALTLIRQEKTKKESIKSKRLVAGWDDSYLLKILGF